jgi:hypothetical protein
MLEPIVSEALSQCPVDRAVYHLRLDPAFTAGFARQDPRKAERYDLVFWLKTSKRTSAKAAISHWSSMRSARGFTTGASRPSSTPHRP